MKPLCKRRVGLALLALSLFFPAAVWSADKKKPVPSPAIDKLSWLAGDWRTEKNNRLIDEQWMRPAGGVMLGMARTLLKGKLVEHGFLQIREGPGGALFYIAQIAGQKEATYQIQSVTESMVVFENQLQEFPQKITYTLQADGSMLLLLEGLGPEGQVKQVESAFHRFAP